MNNRPTENRNITKLSTMKRKAVSTAQLDWVEISELRPGQPLPLLIEPAVAGVNLAEWVANNRSCIESHLLTSGGILFRNFQVGSVAEFEQVVTASSGALLEYQERSSPRREVSGNIYTSTEHPADQTIFLHNENSYANVWPLKIFFHCVTPAQQRGETPIADCRRLYERIDPAIRERFAQKGVMYLRNFGDGLGLIWETAFQTSDRAEVERYCRNAGIDYEWKDRNRLRTRAVRKAIVSHPSTGEMLWFNQATLFHVSTLEASVREVLLSEFAEEDLPLNSYYGDGSPIEPWVLDELRAIHQQEIIAYPWQQGDILMLDNMLVAHGRAPFVGPRKVVVGMTEPISWADLADAGS
jgi:alpha-ketoglutarate-dependent taurine dioxygenase